MEHLHFYKSRRHCNVITFLPRIHTALPFYCTHRSFLIVKNCALNSPDWNKLLHQNKKNVEKRIVILFKFHQGVIKSTNLRKQFQTARSMVKRLPKCNLPLGIATLIPVSYLPPLYSALPPSSLPSSSVFHWAGGRGHCEAWEYPRACTPAPHNSTLPHYLACHHYFTC